MKFRSLTLLPPCLALVFALLLPSAGEAGTGRVRTVGSVKFLDFCVSIRFNATAVQITEIKRAFTDANKVLADATDGQIVFGSIDLVNNSGAGEQAEMWIFSEAGRASATGTNYGTAGEHISAYFPSNFSKVSGADGDAYTIVHEFGHHLWRLGDEYSGPSGDAECEAPPGSATASFCIMDNYFTRGGNSASPKTGYTLNEFCVVSNHDPDQDTRQENRHTKSCWATIGAHATRGATAPAALPTGAAPAVSAPTFSEPSADRRFVLLIDRSGSMVTRDGGSSSPTRLTLAKQAASIFVDLTKAGDELAVVSFDHATYTNMALTKSTGTATQAAAKAAINGLTLGGSTAIGSGLQAALAQITGASSALCVQYIILFTDGESNSGPSELTVIPALNAAHTSVLSVAIGSSVSTANLSKIAGDTSGKFFQVVNSGALPALLAALTSEATGGGVLDRSPGTVAAGATTTRSFLVDPATPDLAVVLTTDPSLSFSLSLVSPGGTTYSAATADIDVISSDGTRIMRVRKPTFVAGTWIARITAGSTGGDFNVTATSGPSGASVVASTDAASYAYPAPILLRVTPIYDLPVLNVGVKASFRRADGTTGEITLFDDGLAAHGDEQANDAVYSARFASFAGSGSYQFDIKADGTAASVTAGGESLFSALVASPALEGKAVPLFHRETSLSVNVTGVVTGDRDGDSLPTTWETQFGFDPDDSFGQNGAAGDPDGDGVSNLQEFQNGTDPRLSNVWNLPEGATGFFTERIAVANPGTVQAVFTVTFLLETGATVVRNFTLAAQARMTIDVNAIPGLSSTAVSAVVRTTAGGIVVERTMIWDAQNLSNYGAHTGKAVAAARTQWFLAEGEASFFDTYILFANANSSAANVTATFLLDTGATIQRNYTVGPNARLTVWANDIPGVRGYAFSTTITSSIAITVERAMYFSTGGRFWNGGHASAAVEGPATNWLIAEGRTGSFFDMFLLLANPGLTPANVTIRYLRPGGAVVTENRTLPPTSRTTIHVDSVPGLSDTDVSASITSDQPIVVERAMYWPDPFPNWYEAHNSVGVTSTGTHWALAEGEIGGTLAWQTYVLLANPNDTPANVTLSFLRTSGAPLVITRTVPANARLTVSASEAGLTSGEQFGVLVESTNNVPIAVEEAMYWNGGNQFWGAGTNETGIKIR